MQVRYVCRVVVLAVLLFMGQGIVSEVALAHRGHEGPVKVFMKEADAMKTMLPKGGKVLKRKELLTTEKHKEALKRWGYSPQEGVYTYFISKGKSGELKGVLFIQPAELKHGTISFAVGYNGDGSLADIKILSCPEQYVKELQEGILEGGFLEKFLHLKTDDVIANMKTPDKESSEDIRHVISKEIRNTAVLLKLFQRL
ncbi:MAG: hypothetical protein IT392_11280 [Nitrospirae bacterium]|nr:hypothetical protein [Nitrospirota bacterium]